MADANAVRERVHEVTDMELRITERHDEYINIFTHELDDFEEDQLMRSLSEVGFEAYPVTKGGHTRKLLVDNAE